MATVLNTIYPPSVATYMPAFEYDTSARIHFSISSFNSAQDIEKVHVSIVDQRTNENVLQAKIEGENGTIKTVALPVAVYQFWTSDNNRDIEKDCPLYNKNTGLFSLDIDPGMLKTNLFNTGQFYKVQLRFDTHSGSENINWISKINDGEDSHYMHSSVDEKYLGELNTYLSENTYEFSEWSQICLIRPILKPRIELRDFLEGEEKPSTIPLDESVPAYDLTNIWITGELLFSTAETESMVTTDSLQNSVNETPEDSSNTEVMPSPIIRNQMTDLERIKKETETLDHYKIYVTDRFGNIIYEDKTTYTANKDADGAINQINALISLEEVEGFQTGQIYFIYIEAYTSNGYLVKNTYFRFEVADLLDKPKFNINFEKDKDNGILTLNIKMNKSYSISPDGDEVEFTDEGILVVRRASDITNFKKWDLIRVYEINNSMWSNDSASGGNGKDYLEFKIIDNTVGSMNWYRYSFQFKNMKGGLSAAVRTDKIIMGDSDKEEDYTQFMHFEDAILSRQNRQLALRYDFTVSSYKPVVNRAKTDTLGGKYPKFTENAVLGYKQFSISGKISSQIDENQLFLNKKDNFGEYAYEKYYELDSNFHDNINEDGDLVQNEKIEYNDCYVHHDNWLEYHDWLWERKFREEAIKWLNDGEPKLLRTLTEGNICVMLTDINLTPEKTLGRRLYNFTATAYEVGDGHDLTTLNNLGIYDIIDETKINYQELIKNAEKEGNKQTSSDKLTYIIEKRIFQLNDFTLHEQEWFYIDKNENVNTGYSINIEDYIRKVINDRLQKTNYSIPDGSGNIWMTNIKISFKNPPHLFVEGTDEQNNPILIEKNKLSETELNASTFIGHRINVKFSNGTKQEIFINSNGYYQIPSDLVVSGIEFPEMAAYQYNKDDHVNYDIIDFDCLLYYQKRIDSKKISSGTSIVKQVIGQEHGQFLPSEQIQDKIYNKHYFLNRINGNPDYFQFLGNWSGVSLDSAPYSLLYLKYYNTLMNKPYDDFTEYEIGQSGHFNLFNNYPIYDLYFYGRKMFRVGSSINNDKQWYDDKNFMREHEFYLESISINSLNDIETPTHQHVYKMNNDTSPYKYYIYWNNSFYPFLLKESEEDIPVNPQGKYLNWTDANNQQDLEPVETIEVLNKVYMLLYNNEWIDVNALLESYNVTSDGEIGIALIPIDATVNYTGTIIRKYY